MRALTDREELAFRNAVNGGEYDRATFEKALSVLLREKALTPPGIKYSTKAWPNGVREWRARREWALDLADRHQLAARAAYAEYWRVFMA